MVPYASSAMLQPVSSFTPVWMPKKNHGQNFRPVCWVMMSFQSCFKLAVNKTISNMHLCLEPNSCISCVQSVDSNCDPLPVVIN